MRRNIYIPEYIYGCVRSHFGSSLASNRSSAIRRTQYPLDACLTAAVPGGYVRLPIGQPWAGLAGSSFSPTHPTLWRLAGCLTSLSKRSRARGVDSRGVHSQPSVPLASHPSLCHIGG